MHYELVGFDPELPREAYCDAMNAAQSRPLPSEPKPHVVLCNSIKKSEAIHQLMTDWNIPSTDYNLMIDDDPGVLTDMQQNSIPYVSDRQFHPIRCRYIGNTLVRLSKGGTLSLAPLHINSILNTISHNCHEQLDKTIARLDHHPAYNNTSVYTTSTSIEHLPTIFNPHHTRQPFASSTQKTCLSQATNNTEGIKEGDSPKLINSHSAPNY